MKKNLILLLFFVITIFLTACTQEETWEPTLFPCEDCHAEADLGDEWIPVWCDEFDGDTIDLTKWTLEDTEWPIGDWDNQLQYYSPNNVFVEEGNLIIEARKETMGRREYTSGRLDTKNKAEWLYGRVIFRAKMAPGLGTWPGLWMLPTDDVYGPWPYSGEIDIAEYAGWDQHRVQANFHTSKYNYTKQNHVGNSLLLEDAENTYNIYEMIWEPCSIKIYMNGEFVVEYTFDAEKERSTLYSAAWPFDQEFHIIMNLAVGGGFGSVLGVNEEDFPSRLIVDYVRVYQRDYAYIDREKPAPVTSIREAGGMFSSMIIWDIPEDDYGVKYYEIYIDGALHGTASVNSYLLTGLKPRTTYQLSVVAVDFSGKKSDSTPIEYSYG